MEPLLNIHSVPIPQCFADGVEECPISGEYILPEYCPDIAVILKCFAYPHILNRQWSGGQLLIDGSSDVRVLYLDQERQTVRSIEFSQPFSCVMRDDERRDVAAVNLSLSTKYVTCRAVSSRRIEVRGAVLVTAHSECAMSQNIAEPSKTEGFYTRSEKVPITIPGELCEKVHTISESLEFDQSLPPAEMLLGGECNAVIKEYKVLTGKVILKGIIYIHQLYMDASEGKSTHLLRYGVPFSQIMDVADAREGALCKASVQVLSDAERCTVGPDGENSVLDVVVKLLIQVQTFQPAELLLWNDAFHCRYPVIAKTEELQLSSYMGQRCEDVSLNLRMTMPSGQWREIIDGWIQLHDVEDSISDGKVLRKGRVLLGCLVRDEDGEISCHESVEEYSLAFSISGNYASFEMVPTDVKFTLNEGTPEARVALNVWITESRRMNYQVISDLSLVEESPYPLSKVNAVLYYATEGESLWEIGRRCHTDPFKIAQGNNLRGDYVDNACVLAVPIGE